MIESDIKNELYGTFKWLKFLCTFIIIPRFILCNVGTLNFNY